MTLLIDIDSRAHHVDPSVIERNWPNQSPSDLAFTHFVMKQYLNGLEAFHSRQNLVSRFTMRAGHERSALTVSHRVSVRDTDVDVYRTYVHYSQDLSIQMRRSHGLHQETFKGAWEGLKKQAQFATTDLATFAVNSIGDFFETFADPSYRFELHTADALFVTCGLPMNPLSCSISIPSRAKVLETLEALGKSL